MTKLGQRELNEQFSRLDDIREEIRQKTNYQIEFFRPPYGAYNNRILNLLNERRMYLIMWSLESGGLDGVNNIVERVAKGLKNGDIVLSHSIRWGDIAACEKILTTISNKGLQAVNLGEGLAKKNKSIHPFTKKFQME